MRILFIHQNFPGQFRHIAAHLASQPGYELLAIGRNTAPGMNGLRLIRYKPHRRPSPQTHPYVRNFEDAVLHGQQVLRMLRDLKAKGYTPDVVVAHPGWGESLFVKDAFPHCRLVHFCEYFYHARGADLGYDPEFPPTLDDYAKIRSRNALHLLNLENCDIGVTPTHWQHSLHPDAYKSKIRVIHEGIDTENLRPDTSAVLHLPNDRHLKVGDVVLTFVARNLEPYRGFHTFMRALPTVLASIPECQVVIVGGSGVSYGQQPKGAVNWCTKMLEENAVNLKQVHFLGQVPYERYLKVLQVSALHTYLTYPFVLSWSLLEAMATGCLLLASDTQPVAEVVKHEFNGLLTSALDSHLLAKAIVHTLNHRDRYQQLRFNAIQTASHYGRDRGVREYRAIFHECCSSD